MEIILEKDYYAIIDTENNVHLTSVKGQSLFDSPAQAKRPIHHTLWWKDYQTQKVLEKIGKSSLVYKLRRLLEEQIQSPEDINIIARSI